MQVTLCKGTFYVASAIPSDFGEYASDFDDYGVLSLAKNIQSNARKK